MNEQKVSANQVSNILAWRCVFGLWLLLRLSGVGSKNMFCLADSFYPLAYWLCAYRRLCFALDILAGMGRKPRRFLPSNQRLAVFKMKKIEKIVFATHNHGKVEEIRGILKDLGIRVVSADEAGVSEDVVEDGKTFEENALIKAEFVGKASGQWAMGDDSGICVEALDGAPGIYSARWAGENAPGEEWVKLLMSKMEGVPEGKRKAWFETTAVLRSPSSEHWTFVGRVDGRIATEAQGVAHPRLSYDVVFIPEGEERTFAEMSGEEKNAISHRGRAFRKLKDFIQNL